MNSIMNHLFQLRSCGVNWIELRRKTMVRRAVIHAHHDVGLACLSHCRDLRVTKKWNANQKYMIGQLMCSRWYMRLCGSVYMVRWFGTTVSLVMPLSTNDDLAKRWPMLCNSLICILAATDTCLHISLARRVPSHRFWAISILFNSFRDCGMLFPFGINLFKCSR